MAKQVEESWFSKAAEKIVRERKDFRLILDELGVTLSRLESEDLFKSKPFQAILRTERNKYANEIASDPELCKKTAVGLMLLCAQNLMEEGNWDKAADVMQKIAKITGWQGADTNVNIFSDLTGKDIERLQREYAKHEARTGESGTLKTTN